MEKITARTNKLIRHFRRLGRERAYRDETGQFLCDGEKLLRDALAAGMEVTGILWKEGGADPGLPDVPVRLAAAEVFDYASPLENSPGPLFSVRRKELPLAGPPGRVLVLENVQDPGNVGTVLRTAAALGTDLVILTGSCADPWQPKCVRASMGAAFRQPLRRMEPGELLRSLREWELPLYAAALAEDAEDIRGVSLHRCAVAVGNEGKGLSRELLSVCDKKLIIPMAEGSESLNAAVAASILMWEMRRTQTETEKGE